MGHSIVCSFAAALASVARASPPVVDPKGVEAFDALLGFLQKKGVKVVLAQPPFNPLFYDAVQGSDYIAGLGRRSIKRREPRAGGC